MSNKQTPAPNVKRALVTLLIWSLLMVGVGIWIGYGIFG
jgi:hypothetical protein